MTTLIDFLEARLAEDEAAARAASQGPWKVDDPTYAEAIMGPDGYSVVSGGRWGDEAPVFETTEDALHIARHDPARVLREVAAKRAIIAAYRLSTGDPHPGLPCTESIEHDPEGRDWDDDSSQGPCERHVEAMHARRGQPHASEHVLKYLAATYSDHEAYREEWRI